MKCEHVKPVQRQSLLVLSLIVNSMEEVIVSQQVIINKTDTANGETMFFSFSYIRDKGHDDNACW